ncbi:elongation of very long chain fatty acids protein 5-like [Varroa jacobsoni]|uniref:elongation of very long chain fatty acids protein 5-like n=1 Tax=Varroa jacobsoni TaxID=62625 RepID=UPI000BF4F976|nr:elongation of very long chain fatty acids protein 5-like [Varroa jacobsoni]
MLLTRFLPARDPRTVQWFGAGDWITLLYILGMYTCTVKVLLPQYMANRKEYKLFGIIRLYNLLLVGVNAFFFCNLITRTYLGGGYNWFCQGIGKDRVDVAVLRLNYYYMFVRIFEFLDTVFFVLRKKFNQASVLNITHHCIAVGLPWYGLAYGLDGQICLMVLINMAVHVVMYSYYFLASFSSIQPYLGWKRYLTLLQIVQFFVVVVHMSVPIVHDCGYPVQNSILVIASYIYFLVMFAAFYDNAYQSRASKYATSKRLDSSHNGAARAHNDPLKIS